MARYIRDFKSSIDPQTVYSAINQYFVSEGYEYINYDGENVYKKGKGMLSNPTFFKFSYCNNTIRMETWMKFAFLPGVYVGELGLSGFVACAAKGPWKKRISNIEGILSNFAMRNPDYPCASVQNNYVSTDDNETQLLNAEETSVMNENTVQPTAANNSAFCNECGSRLPEGALFCTVCGRKCAKGETTVTSQTRQSPQNAFPQPNAFGCNSENPVPPSGYYVSRKEFIDKYAQPSLRRNITGIAILCYVCAGLTFIVSCLLNPFGIIDALVLAAFALGMHLAKSKVCAILILILSIIEFIVSIAFGATPPFWWLAAGIAAVITFSKIDEQYNAFLKR